MGRYFSAPKSVSLTALVGGDDRVREAHRESVTTAVEQLEYYTQARIGGNYPPETTGKFIAAKFEHDTARPVEGYVAPQLHTHAVVFNLTECENGQPRAIQPQSLFASQQFATAVYQSELTYRLKDLGYEITVGRSGAPEIKGYTQEYLDASSPRSQQIREYMERTGRSGREAAEIAAHSTRDRKEVHSPGEVMAAHRKLAADFGHQADAVVRAARERQQHHEKPTNSVDRVRESLTFSRDKNFEREAVVDERVLIRDGLRRGMGDVTHAQVRSNLNARIASGEFQTVERVHMPGRQFTTASRYEINDVIRYSRGSKSTGIEAGEYGKVVSINSAANLLTVERSAGELANYDPRRLKGVSVYREVVREFSVGDRIQFTSPDRSLGIANRDLAVIDFVAADGMITARLDNNRRLDFDSKEHRHFDHGYAVKVAAKPELVQISTAYKQQSEGEKTLPRNKYVEIREEKPDTPEKAKWPEFKTCKFTTEAIVSDGIDKGELRKVCTEPTCSVHHPKKQAPKADASSKSEQEKRRREEALANATGIRVLQSIVAAVPVRLMKRDLLFVTEQLLPLLDEKRLEMVARNRSIKAKDGESVGKLLTAFIRKADEGTIGKLIVESVILLSARSHADGGKTLRAAAQVYGVDTDAVVLKVKQEFVAKEKGRNAKKVLKQPQAKGGKNARAA